MPHSTQPSASSAHTFDLEVLDEHPPSRIQERRHHDDRSMNGAQDGVFGVALTSQTPPPRNEKRELASQRNSVVGANRRRSAPGTHTYAEVMEAAGGPVQEGPILTKEEKKKENRRSHSYNTEPSSKRGSRYYDESFSYKDGAAKEKVLKQSPVIAELKTNVIIKDEFTLVTDLSHHLALRYSRPDSCIMIKVDHSACLALGGNFEPCYILNVQTVPSQMGPSSNKRNAALIQSFMADILSVPSERGIVTFVPIPGENLAQNGSTVYSEMEKAERNDVKRIAAETRKSLVADKRKSNPILNGDSKTDSLTAEPDSSKSITPEPQTNHAATTTTTTTLRDRANSNNSKTGRPSTSHGALNGLRMNPVSVESLVSDTEKLPNNRPKSIGAAEPVSIQEEIASIPITQRTSSTTATTTTNPPKTTKPTTNPKYASGPATTTATTAFSTTPLAPRPVTTTPKKPTTAKPKAEPRQKNTYLDNISTLTTKTSSPPTKQTLDNPAPASPTIIITDSSSEIPLKANTAKRRSTITATPKLPPPALPSPPLTAERERGETKSMSSRLSKRKSFLRLFKRSSIPAWYEQ